MSLHVSSEVEGQESAACKNCGGDMNLARLDAYPMPRGRIEILTLECAGCGSRLQQVRASLENS